MLTKYPAEVKIIKHADGRSYVQVTRDVRLDDGRMTTEVIKSAGVVTPEKIRLAEELVRDLNAHLNEKDAPKLEINPARLRSLQEGPLLGFLSPEVTPRVWYGLYAVVEAFLTPQVKNENNLRGVIKLTQPDLKTEEEVNRFYQWIKDKPDDEKVRILIKRWHY